jgi:hypothetical protein
MVTHIRNEMTFSATTKEANFLFSHVYMPPKFTLLQINQKSFDYKTKAGKGDWVRGLTTFWFPLNTILKDFF